MWSCASPAVKQWGLPSSLRTPAQGGAFADDDAFLGNPCSEPGLVKLLE